MRELTYFVAVTIDGFVAGPDGGNPGFFRVTQDYIDTLVEEYPETIAAPARKELGVAGDGARFDTVVEGRRSYDVGLDAGLTNAYPHLRHLVFSRTLKESPDPAVELVRTDPVEKVRELKQLPGKGIWLVGGAELAGVLYSEIDQLVLKLNPVAIGTGIPLFGAKAQFDVARFDLVDHKPLDGVTLLTYTRSAS